ncbi:MAG: cytochrome-c oxidase, cbb3-type subunit III [Pseudomonadota bacterium]
MQVDRDPVSGQTTTGHEWDGLKELNTPVPQVAKWAMRIAIVFALAYTVFYPAWPVAFDYTRGMLGYSARGTVEDKVAAAEAAIQPFLAPLSGDLDELADDPMAREAYFHAGAVLYRDNCSMCHRPDAKGQTLFPNLVDETWLWDGSASEIYVTLLHGINYPHDDDTRLAQMPAYGKLEMLEGAQITEVIEYVRHIGGFEHDAEAAAPGAVVFEENCAACHGDGGEGGLGIGAPSLVDEAWIYGGDYAALEHTLEYGRAGVMPGWQGRLSDADIRQLALYIRWLNDPAEDAE